ncbi:stage II sporulation protein M [Paeniglutamicibacter cryotolerans]|uniref:Putative membrane protein SpoIIM required for sporulation n=1 Tax=Paeniglutamicibacter cryotolerans TaxID=670079 RepID=A0A839QPP2_9MICC|nr:stage II sporulation protein M [Paeniglutamicibacter cryotolerans]MBB2995956.1 putative membrane protein SpoIIM required for sporulation [Paeniglutamicibacter cryotolerans]
MDLDAFVAVHQQDWARLDALSALRRPTGAQIDEFLALYERTSAHLSMIRSIEAGTEVSADVSARLARARTRFTGVRGNAGLAVSDFLTTTLPAALYRLRLPTLVIGTLFCLVALAFGAWVARNPAVLAAMGDQAELGRYVNEEFVAYYSTDTAASFAGAVWTNNAQIAALSVAFGITGILVPYMLFQNAMGIGISGGVMASHGQADTFFLYILPHGFMELTAIFVAGAAGLRIFWAWVAPGPRRRVEALAAEGRSLMTVALGLVPILLVSGLVEGFVTPSGLPGWARLGLGLCVVVGYWVYTLVLGRRAVARGATGDLQRYEAGATAPRAG